MIANNRIFLSLYVILTINLMMIESKNKVSPSYYVSQIFSHSYINIVNTLKTYNQQEIKLSEKERTILTTPIQTYNDTKGRNTVFDKFDKKIEDVKCTCTLIVKSKLVYLENILEGLRRGEPIEIVREELNVLKEEAGLIVLMFQKGQVKAGKWFWSYYLKIMTIIDYDSNKNYFGEPAFGEEELHSGITKFIKYCKDNKYLPKNRTEFDLVSKNPQVPFNIFRILRASAELTADYITVMQNITIDQLYLKPLWDKHELLFGQITGSAVEWRPTIRRHAVELNKTKEYIDNRQWVSKPFGHLSYHKLIKQIVNTRVYIFLWVMLVILDKLMPNMDENSFKAIYRRTIDTVDTVFEFMEFSDGFFYDIAAEYAWTMPEDTNLGDLIARISVRAKDSLVELNGRNSNGTDWISINVNGQLNNVVMTEFLNEFADNFYQLKAKLGTFYYVLGMSLPSEGD
ncbi:uncharacterized protein LOC126839651 [Adelges cooleyi]|uniref:uncharacterized protein LOC126839651 n=1 Tax=Adelges cooleyi TaxID=133065 RepID=UPI00217F3F37|nr:uncharacterized protein LOC126839651 [Adelges cooleyi]